MLDIQLSHTYYKNGDVDTITRTTFNDGVKIKEEQIKHFNDEKPPKLTVVFEDKNFDYTKIIEEEKEAEVIDYLIKKEILTEGKTLDDLTIKTVTAKEV